MGRNLDAFLAYGYRLKDPEEGWLVEEAKASEDVFDLGWYKEDYNEDPDDVEYSADFESMAESRLLAKIAQFTVGPVADKVWVSQGYYDRRRAAEAIVGVKFAHVGHEGFTAKLLVAGEGARTEWYDATVVDLSELEAFVEAGDWDRKLARAIDALGIRPTQAKPEWLLCASYG